MEALLGTSLHNLPRCLQSVSQNFSLPHIECVSNTFSKLIYQRYKLVFASGVKNWGGGVDGGRIVLVFQESWVRVVQMHLPNPNRSAPHIKFPSAITRARSSSVTNEFSQVWSSISSTQEETSLSRCLREASSFAPSGGRGSQRSTNFFAIAKISGGSFVRC